MIGIANKDTVIFRSPHLLEADVYNIFFFQHIVVVSPMNWVTIPIKAKMLQKCKRVILALICCYRHFNSF